MNIAMIAAVATNNLAIGYNNELLCHIKADMQRFKSLTLGHTVVMGRSTFESLPNHEPLKNRRNIVLTRDIEWEHEGVEIAHSINELFNLIEDEEDEIFIIGGGEIYKKMIKFADTLYITWIYKEFENADTFFPKIDPKKFRADTVSEIYTTKSGIQYSFYTYNRRNSERKIKKITGTK